MTSSGSAARIDGGGRPHPQQLRIALAEGCRRAGRLSLAAGGDEGRMRPSVLDEGIRVLKGLSGGDGGGPRPEAMAERPGGATAGAEHRVQPAGGQLLVQLLPLIRTRVTATSSALSAVESDLHTLASMIRSGDLQQTAGPSEACGDLRAQVHTHVLHVQADLSSLVSRIRSLQELAEGVGAVVVRSSRGSTVG